MMPAENRPQHCRDDAAVRDDENRARVVLAQNVVERGKHARLKRGVAFVQITDAECVAANCNDGIGKLGHHGTNFKVHFAEVVTELDGQTQRGLNDFRRLPRTLHRARVKHGGLKMHRDPGCELTRLFTPQVGECGIESARTVYIELRLTVANEEEFKRWHIRSWKLEVGNWMLEFALASSNCQHPLSNFYFLLFHSARIIFAAGFSV